MRRIDLGRSVRGSAGHLDESVGGGDHSAPASRAGSVAAVAESLTTWSMLSLSMFETSLTNTIEHERYNISKPTAG